jgi:hypothetical protein
MERLEFAGDARLAKFVRIWLYQTFPDAGPGTMTIMASFIESNKHLYEVYSILNLSVVLNRPEDLLRTAKHRSNRIEAIIAELHENDRTLEKKLLCFILRSGFIKWSQQQGTQKAPQSKKAKSAIPGKTRPQTTARAAVKAPDQPALRKVAKNAPHAAQKTEPKTNNVKKLETTLVVSVPPTLNATVPEPSGSSKSASLDSDTVSEKDCHFLCRVESWVRSWIISMMNSWFSSTFSSQSTSSSDISSRDGPFFI